METPILQLHELSVGRKRSVGDERMQGRVEVRRVGAERLDRDDKARLHVAPVEDRAEARDDSVATRTGDEPQQPPFALQDASQDPRDRQHDVPMGHSLENLGDQLLGEQGRALGLAGGAEVAGLAAEGEQVLGAAVGAADAGEARLQPAAVQVRLHRRSDHGPQRTVARLVPLLVDLHVPLEVLLEELVEGGPLGMPRPVNIAPLLRTRSGRRARARHAPNDEARRVGSGRSGSVRVATMGKQVGAAVVDSGHEREAPPGPTRWCASDTGRTSLSDWR
jgi:hypothetical protein